ncbi:hypothetical protein F2Q70_00011585 [Brassica cretica]|uniref:Uncharacterized protein n=1 Tax=Brassica cretica TaxID=69181 RepID=A0A8S9MA58_BRACR|nr:hypothetical protein F2Q70_00011585 [Brassica cretica]
MRNPTPFWSKRIAVVDLWWQSVLVHDFTQFKIKPCMFNFKRNGYEDMVKGKLPDHCPKNLKWTLAEEFGSVAKATDLDSQHVDFVLVSPSKATKDDKDAKVPAYGRGCRGKHIVKGEEADEKKKAAQADASFKRKEKAEAKKKATEAKKKEAEAKKKEAEAKKKEIEAKKKKAEGKKKQEAEGKKKEDVLKKRKQAESKNKEVTPSGEDSVFADVTNEVVGGENEFAPESDVEGSELHTHP